MNLDLFGNELKPLETPVAALEDSASDDYLLFLKKFENHQEAAAKLEAAGVISSH